MNIFQSGYKYVNVWQPWQYRIYPKVLSSTARGRRDFGPPHYYAHKNYYLVSFYSYTIPIHQSARFLQSTTVLCDRDGKGKGPSIIIDVLGYGGQNSSFFFFSSFRFSTHNSKGKPYINMKHCDVGFHNRK